MHQNDLTADSAGVTVLNPRGEEIELASLWSDRLIVLAFLRHFG